MAESSTVARWELALRIKARREELGLTAGHIAAELGFTRNFFSAVENERAMLAEDKLEAAMELLTFDERERAEMRVLDRIGRKRGWWESHEEILGPEAKRFLGLEQGASEIRTFESLAIAGLVQTSDYMTAVFDRDPALGRVQMKNAIRIRQQRQDSLIRSARPVKMLVSEASLVQVWATPKIQSEQLRHMLELTELGNLEIRVLPFDRPPGPIATSSTMIILDFESTHLPSVIWQEPIRSVNLLEDGDGTYERIRIIWEESYERALSPTSSIEKILEIADQMMGQADR